MKEGNRIKPKRYILPNLRGVGNNYAILADFDQILIPQMVVPAR